MTQASSVPGSITVIGEALIDLVPGERVGEFTAHPGGSPYNVAIGLARLGVDTSLMARLADNAFGRLLRARAEREGVDLAAAVRASDLTTLAVVSLDAEARASYEFYVEGTADWQWTAEETARLPVRTNILHFGSIASWTSPADEHIAALARRVRAAGTAVVSYDPNVRPHLLTDPQRGRVLVERSVALTHLVKASAEDVAWLYPGESVDAVARHWLTLGPALVIVTDGAAGATAFTPASAPTVQPGVEVALVDTVGAGDSFSSALLASLLRRGITSPARLDAIAKPELAGALRDAVSASALTCERAGADPPTLDDLAASAQRTDLPGDLATVTRRDR